MGIRTVVISAVIALTGTLGAGAASARSAEVQWSITVGSPVQVRHAPVHVRVAPVHVRHRPVHHVHRSGHAPRHVHRTDWDRDGDGIPNRYDRRPNRYGR